MNYSFMNDSGPLDMSTAPPSASNMGYQYSQSNANNNTNAMSSQQNYSNQFWRKPQNQNTQTHTQNQQTLTPLPTAGTSYSVSAMSNDEVDRLKMQLKIKESQIESLESEIQRLNDSMTLNTTTGGVNSIPKQVPSSLNEVFVELSLKYIKAQEELDSTKTRLEGLVTAITLNPSNSVTNHGRYDELEVSHKILIKLENLKKENEELMKQLSFGKMKQMEMEMNLLKMEMNSQQETNDRLMKENQELLRKLTELQK